MTDERKPEGIEPWVTVQLFPPGPGGEFVGYYAAFLVPGAGGVGLVVEVRAVSWYALQHLSYDDDEGEQLESRIVPCVLMPTAEVLYLDAGAAGGPDHGFAGLGNDEADAERIGAAVLAELNRARSAK